MKSNYLHKIESEEFLEYIDQVNMPDRDKEIAKMFATGKDTYRQIADQFEISGERVRQLVEKFARKSYHIKSKNCKK